MVYHARVRKQKSISNLLGWAAFLPVSALVAIAAGQASNEAIHGTGVDARINRIVSGLLPAAIIKGQPMPRMMLEDRMKYYNVPEMSIAFFDNGQIAWAHGYGMADKAANKPVTPAAHP
jgi:CubicO group peptidase (beta-lactamase class C family)